MRKDEHERRVKTLRKDTMQVRKRFAKEPLISKYTESLLAYTR
jgi:hypothetical protein